MYSFREEGNGDTMRAGDGPVFCDKDVRSNLRLVSGKESTQDLACHSRTTIDL